jgi:hypothetical protein
MTSRSRLAKWREWIDGRIANEIMAMHLRRVPWREVNEAAKAQDLPASYWWEYFSDTYAVTQSIAIRRQVDDDEHALSLGRLLTEIAAHPEECTRTHWLELWSEEDRDVYALGERQWADNYASDDDSELLKPQVPAEALVRLQEGSAKMKRYVDRHIAHHDRRGLPPDQMPTYNDIDAAIDLVGETFSEFVPLLQAQSYITLTPEFQDDWRAVFRVPWMPR